MLKDYTTNRQINTVMHWVPFVCIYIPPRATAQSTAPRMENSVELMHKKQKWVIVKQNHHCLMLNISFELLLKNRFADRCYNDSKCPVCSWIEGNFLKELPKNTASLCYIFFVCARPKQLKSTPTGYSKREPTEEKKFGTATLHPRKFKTGRMKRLHKVFKVNTE